METITTKISKEIHWTIKKMAAERQTTIIAIINKALTEYIDKEVRK